MVRILTCDNEDLRHQVLTLKECVAHRKLEKKELQRRVAAVKKQVSRLKVKHDQMKAKANSKPIMARIMVKGVYTAQIRALARSLVQAGCSTKKVGPILQAIGKTFGLAIPKVMSARTASRCVLEGLVAADIQLGYEMSQANSLTISQDSTSNRHVNYESHHIALRVPDYTKGETTPSDGSIPINRLLRVASTVDHSSENSKARWMEQIGNIQQVYNESPLSQRIGGTFNLRQFALKLKGMNGDHATAEKSTARMMGDWKKKETLRSLGEEALLEKDVAELLQYLCQKWLKIMNDAGGWDAWHHLPLAEQARRDAEMMSQIMLDVGQDVYEQLLPDRRRQLDLFLWAGCCMHKDQNSFKGGNSAMTEWWKTASVPGPVLLANKTNAAVIRDILDPSKKKSPLTDVEVNAIETSTCGGAKAAALAGAIFNNKDDKKGYGDTYTHHCLQRLGKASRFPDTSNTRFNSHAEAAAVLLTYLDFHQEFLVMVKHKKQKSGWTNIELNVHKALEDSATLTELAVMVMYSLAITHPYLRIVRGHGTTNVLNLGKLHQEVRDHCKTIIDSPQLLVSAGASYQSATLDGLEWENSEVVTAIKALLPHLPHIIPVTRAFFTGALATWERFSSEFAPGGLIDMANANERELAWMSSTNDVNEGILGAYRVTMREKPTLTLHQCNARLLLRQNHTQDFMDVLLNEKDYTYIRKKARAIDASGLEKE